MLEQSGILAAPGMGSVFLVVVLFCFIIVKKIITARGMIKDADTLPAELSSPSPAAEVNIAPGVVAAIVAAVTEYRKSHS
jgi:Na+-transporting methylmalonyl-CoA/oxaloacetate decarboxylase gamma subunit